MAKIDAQNELDDLEANYPVTEEGQTRQKRAPSYDIQWQNPSGAWEDVGSAIEAPNAREAIRLVTDNLPADDEHRWGAFKVTRAGEARLLNRVKKVIPETIADDWS
jgi:hypothetical protein